MKTGKKKFALSSTPRSLRLEENQSKGMTIVELLVAMTIFIIVITLAVGGFVSLVRLQAQSESITDVQQNARVVLEQMTRLARQAENISISDNSDLDTVTFTISGQNIIFSVDNKRLEKTPNLTLTSDDVEVTKFNFTKDNGFPPRMNILVEIKAVNPSGAQATDNIIKLESSVVLTGLK